MLAGAGPYPPWSRKECGSSKPATAGADNEGPWGGADCIPVPGDYDGDGKSDLVVYRAGYWSIYTMAGNVIAGGWGAPGWTPVY